MPWQSESKPFGTARKTNTLGLWILVHGVIPNTKPDTLASEALVFLLVGTRSHWKCLIGYFLVNKITAEDQEALVLKSLEKAAKTGLKVWSVTADGTSVNLSTFEILGCKFDGTYDNIKTSFTHGEDVFAILDPIAISTQMFSAQSNPFKYILTYKFPQDHVELLFSCIRSRGGGG